MFKIISDTLKVNSQALTQNIGIVQRTCIRRCQECKQYFEINSCSLSAVRCSRHNNQEIKKQNGVCYRTITSTRRKNISK